MSDSEKKIEDAANNFNTSADANKPEEASQKLRTSTKCDS